ncbi:MAG: hypothetical protein AAGH65_09470 [Pseudomonadota bacterium]
MTLCTVILLATADPAWAQSSYSIELEAGPTWQARNDVQIPNDASADRFDLTDILGSGPWATARLNAIWNLNERHGLRLVLAPLVIEERGQFDQDVRFNGETFIANTPVDARYRFNSWRLGYRYQFYDANDWQFWVGGTLKLRDANIRLMQGVTRANDDDLGLVPLLHLAGEYQLNPRWHFEFDFDGLVAGPGRALDLGLKLGYAVNDHWRITAGYRGFEGGVDIDDVYSFGWFNTALLSAQYRF